MNIRILVFTCVCLLGQIVPAGAQSIFHRADSILTQNYSKGNVDTAYVMRPATKWTITARMNVSGAKMACMHIGFGKGVCGTAWKEQRTIIVPDVEQFPGHIACSSLSRSEIVVPVFSKDGKATDRRPMVGNEVVAVLDIDSKELSTNGAARAHNCYFHIRFLGFCVQNYNFSAKYVSVGQIFL